MPSIAHFSDSANLPKIVLHDHLDGGLRPDTVEELLHAQGVALPWTPGQASVWFQTQANAKSLPRYLDTFEMTLACMQRADFIQRIAREAAQDLVMDNVRYAELRFAPLLCTRNGLSPEAVVEAALDGLRGYPIKLLLCAMRQNDPADSMRTVDLALRYRDHGVVGVDLAGPEEGFLPSRHTSAFKKAESAGLGITIHAGEVSGMESLRSAVKEGFAHRLGHGIQLSSTMQANGGLDPLAWEILERNLVLEVCPSSNVQTGAVSSMATHPWKVLDYLGFPITLNTDNRLMGGVSTSMEWDRAVLAFGITPSDAIRHTETAIGGIFGGESMKAELRQTLRNYETQSMSSTISPGN